MIVSWDWSTPPFPRGIDIGVAVCGYALYEAGWLSIECSSQFAEGGESRLMRLLLYLQVAARLRLHIDLLSGLLFYMIELSYVSPWPVFLGGGFTAGNVEYWPPVNDLQLRGRRANQLCTSHQPAGFVRSVPMSTKSGPLSAWLGGDSGMTTQQ
jgi:hypothetical protein